MPHIPDILDHLSLELVKNRWWGDSSLSCERENHGKSHQWMTRGTPHDSGNLLASDPTPTLHPSRCERASQCSQYRTGAPGDLNDAPFSWENFRGLTMSPLRSQEMLVEPGIEWDLLWENNMEILTRNFRKIREIFQNQTSLESKDSDSGVS